MDMRLTTKISSVAMLTALSLPANSATFVADARGNGMGNTGVTSADYLLGAFYNPALVAVHRENDNFGLLLPSIGANVRDGDESLKVIDDLQDTIERFDPNNPDPATEDQLNAYLDQLADDKPLGVNGGAGAAVAFPINTLSANVFVRGYADVIGKTNIADDSDTQARYENSTVNLWAFGYTEVGVALAKRITLSGQDIAIGVTPKYQELRTYKETISVEDFDISDYDQSENKQSHFNMDLGVVWFYQNLRLGIAAKDLFSKDIETIDGLDKYAFNTQVTASGSYVSDYFVAALDVDLTKQERFEVSALGVEDDTQFVRFGIEGNAFGWAQLRLGYQVDLEETLDDSVTVGLGISPGDLVSLDFAGSYAGDNQFGASANLAFTF